MALWAERIAREHVSTPWGSTAGPRAERAGQVQSLQHEQAGALGLDRQNGLGRTSGQRHQVSFELRIGNSDFRPSQILQKTHFF